MSTADQDLRLQIDALLKDGVREEDIYRETVSGAKKSRPEFDLMMRELRPGDVVTVWKLDRLSRSLPAMLKTIEEIHSKGAKLRILTQQIDTSTAGGKLFLNMLMVIADFEREIGRERTVAGLASARERGKVGGRRRTFSEEQIRSAKALHDRGATWPKAAASIKISVPRLQARIRQLCPTN